MKIYKDKRDPDNWISFESTDHKYVGIPQANTKKISYRVYHRDDCTLNSLNFIFDVPGNKHKVAAAINQHEIQKRENIKAIQKLIKEGS